MCVLLFFFCALAPYAQIKSFFYLKWSESGWRLHARTVPQNEWGKVINDHWLDGLLFFVLGILFRFRDDVFFSLNTAAKIVKTAKLKLQLRYGSWQRVGKYALIVMPQHYKCRQFAICHRIAFVHTLCHSPLSLAHFVCIALFDRLLNIACPCVTVVSLAISISA